VQVEILGYKRAEKKEKKYGDEVVGWMDGLFTDGLCTAAVIGKLLRQPMLKVSEGAISLQLQ
jgi:hypothetical protein